MKSEIQNRTALADDERIKAEMTSMNFQYSNFRDDIANMNTEIYEKVFHCIPSDKVQNFLSLKKYKELQPLYVNELDRAEDMLDRIQGHLVLLPLNFMCNEVLTPMPGTVEGIMPTALWT